MQKVVVFSKLFWPEGGGAELATYLIVRDILSKAFEVIIVSGTRRPEPDILGCVKYVYWPTLRTPLKPLEWLKLGASSNILHKLMNGADVVYIPSHTLLPLAIVAKRVRRNVKVVLHLHNYQPISYTSVYIENMEVSPATEALIEYLENDSIARAMATGLIGWANIVNRIALKYSDAVICVSRRQLSILKRFIRGLEGKTTVIYNPLPPIPNVEKKLGGTPLAIYSGGDSYVKGFNVLLRAINDLRKRGVRMKLVFTNYYSLKALREIAKLRDKSDFIEIEILGRIPHKQLEKLHESSWALLFPSIWEEPLPYAVIESMLAGTIPIASRVGGVPEIVQGTYAEKMLFAPGDVNEFVRRVEEVLSLSREQIQDIGIGLREEILRKFDPEVTKRKLLEVFGAE